METPPGKSDVARVAGQPKRRRKKEPQGHEPTVHLMIFGS